jgi:hypothetical protein
MLHLAVVGDVVEVSDVNFSSIFRVEEFDYRGPILAFA